MRILFLVLHILPIPPIKILILFLTFYILNGNRYAIPKIKILSHLCCARTRLIFKILDLYYINTSNKNANSVFDIAHFEWQLICHSENKNVMPPMLCETRLILKFLTFITSIPQLKIPILFLTLQILNGN